MGSEVAMDVYEPNGVIAVFASEGVAHTAIRALDAARIDPRSISILGPGETGERPVELDDKGAHAKDVAAYWAEWGAIAGAGAGAAVVAIPLIAAVVGLGPFAVALAAIPLATSAVGALAGGLIGLGIHEAHAHRYEKALRAGKFLVVVHTDDLGLLEDARDILSRGAESVETHGLKKLRGRAA
jgi:hypothetical protein